MLAILGGVSWGISGVCSQYLFTQYDLSADWLTAIRMLLSGILLLVTCFPKGTYTGFFKIWTKGKDTFWLIAFALAGLLLCQYTFLAAIKHSNSATATVLQSLNVVLMAIVMAVWNKKNDEQNTDSGNCLGVFRYLSDRNEGKSDKHGSSRQTLTFQRGSSSQSSLLSAQQLDFPYFSRA